MGHVLPGKGSDILKQRTSLYETLAGDVVFTNPNKRQSPDFDYGDHPSEQELASYAKKQWENVVNRDGMLPVTPDEEDTLHVPAGMTAIFMAVGKRNGKMGRHWYRADRPADESAPVTWSHWDGDSVKKYAGMSSITDPFKQCAFDKYKPVGYFLVPSQKAAGANAASATMTTPQISTAAPP